MSALGMGLIHSVVDPCRSFCVRTINVMLEKTINTDAR